ncbi:MAG: hypothetical protein HUU21_38100, partial [Polyangiaceae bacterium]|nr:hypothetical protein [Polyangiaceae bacterium]
MNRFWSLLGLIGISSALVGLSACAGSETDGTSSGGDGGEGGEGGSGGG